MHDHDYGQQPVMLVEEGDPVCLGGARSFETIETFKSVAPSYPL
jgi:hypothetical protein